MAYEGNSDSGEVLTGVGASSPASFAPLGTRSGLTGVITGNGNSQFTASTVTQNAVLIGGSSNSVSSISNLGSAGQALLSNGAGLPPSWGTVSAGDVVGPASSTDNALVRFDSTTGKLLQNGVTTEDDTGNLSTSASVSGSSLSYTIANTSNTASSTAFYNAQVAGATASDAYYKAEISGGQAWSWGLDNSASDAYVLAASSTLGSTNVMSVTTDGEITYPLQPAFLAYLASTANDKTGNGTSYTLGTDALTKVYDQNSDFNTNGTFTAPITGKYKLDCTIWVTGNTVATVFRPKAVVSNGDFQTTWSRAGSSSDGSGSVSLQTDMDAGDTAVMQIAVFGEAAATSDIRGAADRVTSYGGHLIC